MSDIPDNIMRRAHKLANELAHDCRMFPSSYEGTAFGAHGIDIIAAAILAARSHSATFDRRIFGVLAKFVNQISDDVLRESLEAALERMMPEEEVEVSHD
jgi:hypothetical protein